MRRAWSEYSVGEWGRLRPFTDAVRAVRLRAIDRHYRHRPAAGGDIVSLLPRLTGHNVLVTLACGDVNAVRWQVALVGHYVPGAVHVVVDNSPTDQPSRIQRVCAAEGAHYVQLPSNKWTGRMPDRSRGLALNWVWENLVLPAGPEAFGFLDDDLFPTAPDDPFALLKTQDVYGPIRRQGGRWALWPGFCLFRFDRVAHLPLDFRPDTVSGLGVGGGNWGPLYSSLDVAGLCEPVATTVSYAADVPVEQGPLQWFGSWLHEARQSGRPSLFDERRRALEALIAPHLATALRPFVEPASASLL